MPFNLNPDDMATVRAHLGSGFGDLRQTMLDVDAFPVFLFSDDRPRLVHSRERAIKLLDDWLAHEPQVVGDIHARLPELVRRRSSSESLLEAVTWDGFSDPLIDLFQFPRVDSRVFAAAPHLISLLDESGLVTVTGVDARPWGLHTGEYAFQYHQLLRRGFGSGIHYGLIATVLRAAKQHQLTARLALDDRRLQFKSEYQEHHEADYWYGPPLTEADLDNLSAIGETFHGDPEDGRSLLSPYAGLSIRWTSDGNLKTVQIEEFMPPQEPESDWVFARYLHAIRDTDLQKFVHCDGAVKAYAAATYPRAQHDFKYRGKGNYYRKLFRIDGQFPASVWAELASSWFRGNRLINEYFEGHLP